MQRLVIKQTQAEAREVRQARCTVAVEKGAQRLGIGGLLEAGCYGPPETPNPTPETGQQTEFDIVSHSPEAPPSVHFGENRLKIVVAEKVRCATCAQGFQRRKNGPAIFGPQKTSPGRQVVQDRLWAFKKNVSRRHGFMRRLAITIRPAAASPTWPHGKSRSSGRQLIAMR